MQIKQGANEISLIYGGTDEDRTRDLLLARQALSQTELRPHKNIRAPPHRLRGMSTA